MWVLALLAALLGTPMYFSAPYVATIESMAVVNTYMAYGMPILFKWVQLEVTCSFCRDHGVG